MSYNIPLQSQDIKYREVFRAYEKNDPEADSLLLQFLKGEESRHPHAYYKAGVYYSEVTRTMDLYGKTDSIVVLMDMAESYLERSSNLIDDRELNRNSRYYEEFVRRKMRSGKAVVSIYDFRHRIDELLEVHARRERARDSLLYYSEMLQQKFIYLRELYDKLWRGMESEPQFYLSSGLSTMSTLNTLSESFVNFKGEVDRYGEMIDVWYGNSPMKPQIAFREISDPLTEGRDTVDFTSKNIVLSHYGQFADEAEETIRSRIFPLRQTVADHDSQLNEVIQILRGGGLPDSAGVYRIMNSFDRASLLKLDPDPFPLHMFDLKENEIEFLYHYNSFHNLPETPTIEARIRENRVLRDRVREVVQKRLSITAMDIDMQFRKYRNYVDVQYGGFAGLNDYLREHSNRYDSILYALGERIDSLTYRNSYVRVDGQEVPIDTSVYDRKTRYRPILVTDYVSVGRVTGNQFSEFYIVPVLIERVASTLHKLTISNKTVSTYTDVLAKHNTGNGDIWVILFPDQDEKEANPRAVVVNYPVYVIKVSSSDVLTTKLLTIPGKPVSLGLTRDDRLTISFTLVNGLRNFVELNEDLTLKGMSN